MDFIVVRLGKDSVFDIKKLNESNPNNFEPFSLDFSCKQVEQSIKPGAFVFLYLGSDNNKGVPTEWHQGMRALGRLEDIDGWENFQSLCTLKISVLAVFQESLDQFSFLEKSPNLYKYFSKYPVIGVKSSRNNSVQKVNDDPRENTSALLTAIHSIFPEFELQISKVAPELIPLIGFVPADEVGATQDEKQVRAKESDLIGTNTIFYGAPGTGKSYSIDKTADPDHSIKTVFHAETMNSDFVGTIKPVMSDTGSGEKSLTYDFIPGPFIRSLINALNNTENHHWLVIEEINRAPAAAVFGEIFQLLDRDANGKSSYEIDFPDPLCKEFVNSRLNNPIEKLFIPSNLSIYASMNSSDQGVLPLDTAFKRRWKFSYVPLDFEKGCTNENVELVVSDNEVRGISWSNFAQSINHVLAAGGIPEDRHLGPYFLSPNDFIDKETVLTGKLFMYLWDDVLRHGLRYRLFNENIKTYGQLVRFWEDKKTVLHEEFLENIEDFVFDLNNDKLI